MPPIVGEAVQRLLTTPGGTTGKQFSARYAVGVVSPIRMGVGPRCWAGLIAKLVLGTTLVLASMLRPLGHDVGAVHPESISALFRIQYCAPIKRPVVMSKSLTEIRNLSLL